MHHDWDEQVPEDLLVPSTRRSVPVGERDHANLRNVFENRKLRGLFNQLSSRDLPPGKAICNPAYSSTEYLSEFPHHASARQTRGVGKAIISGLIAT